MTVRILMIASLLCVCSQTLASAQAVSGLPIKTKKADTLSPDNALCTQATPDAKCPQVKERQINLAVPAGATAAVGDDKSAAAGPVLGFQAWRLDDFFAGAFFTFDAASTLNGDARKAAEFVRHPPAKGTSFYANASRILWALTTDHTDRFKPAARAREERTEVAFLGFSVRAGVTNATFERKIAGSEDVEKREAFVTHLTPSLLLTSRTYREENSDNEYQFGLEFGPSWRFVGGDAAHDTDFLKNDDVWGHGDTVMFGGEGTVFVRLNAFQPFVRITWFGKREGTHIKGLTGAQAFFGVNVLSALFQASKEASPR